MNIHSNPYFNKIKRKSDKSENTGTDFYTQLLNRFNGSIENTSFQDQSLH